MTLRETDIPDGLMEGAAGYRPVVSSWFDGELLHDDLPVMSGSVTVDTKQTILDSFSAVFAPYDLEGRSMVPGGDIYHPLAKYGQRLDVRIVIQDPLTRAEYDVDIGVFRIESWEVGDDGDVSVNASSLLQIVADDGLMNDFAPASGATMMSEASRLVSSGILVEFSDELPDVRIPTSIDWGKDRVEALGKIAKSWPANIRMSEDGVIMFTPPLPHVLVPSLELTDGEGGVVMSLPDSDSRDGLYNRWIVRSSATDESDEEPPWGYFDVQYGPYRVYNEDDSVAPYGIVSREWSSPLLVTRFQCRKAARTMARKYIVESKTLSIEMPPDPRIKEDTIVRVRYKGRVYTGPVLAYELPLVHTETARYDIGVGELEALEDDG